MDVIQECIQLVLNSDIPSKAIIVNKLQGVASLVNQQNIKIKDLEQQVQILKESKGL